MTNEQAVVEESTFSVRRRIRIAAPIEKVWQAVTVPEYISSWFGRTVLDGHGVGTITWPERYDIPIRVEAIDEPHMVSYRWCNDDALGSAPSQIDDGHSTVFTFTLESVAGGTELTVVESGFDATSAPLENLENHRLGWNGELDKLVALLEGVA